jgi:membrane-associated phospholipid phosphatase
MLALGVACLAAAALMGVVAQRQEIWLDHALPGTVGRLVSPGNLLVRILSSESGWPHGSYLTAVAPVAFTMAVLAVEARRRGLGPVVERWRWVLLTLLAIPVHYGLRVGFGRPGPDDAANQALVVGAYPSGAALAVGLGWALCVVVVGVDRPRWRPWLMAAAAVALFLHAVVRSLTDKHWASDILGSYLLVAAAFLFAGSTRSAGPA